MALSITERMDFLKKTILFANVSDDSLRWIAENVEEVHLADGETIFSDGDKGDAFYIIFDGQISIHKFGMELVRRGKHECIGETAVIDDGPRSASATAIGDATLLKMEITRDEFYSALQADKQYLQNVFEIVATKFREDINREIDTIRELERVRYDMARARQLQMNILPPASLCVETSDGLCLEASGRCFPAENVGGDYYDYFPLEDDNVGVVVGDVMGHGFHTGLLVFTAKSSLYTQIRADYSIENVMSAINNMVYRFVRSDISDTDSEIAGMFMSFCYMIINLRNYTVSFSNAGHPDIYHYRADTGNIESLESNSILLGIIDEPDYSIEHTKLNKGDIFVLYSDGIIEAESKDGELFGNERLKELITVNNGLTPAKLRDVIFKAVKQHCQNAIQLDDLSLVVVKIS